MGGLSLAALDSSGMTVLAGIDTDSDSLKTFSAPNFPEAVAIEATVSGKKAVEIAIPPSTVILIPDAPLIVLSGPPCQGFSAAGSRDPSDKRNKILLGVLVQSRHSDQPVRWLRERQELLTDKHRKRVKNFEKHLLDAGSRVLPSSSGC